MEWIADMTTRDAETRWPGYRAATTSPTPAPSSAAIEFGSIPAWRRHPACEQQREIRALIPPAARRRSWQTEWHTRPCQSQPPTYGRAENPHWYSEWLPQSRRAGICPASCPTVTRYAHTVGCSNCNPRRTSLESHCDQPAGCV